MIRCPHCMNEMEVKGLHAGSFNPKCPSCGRRFSLSVPEEGAEPVVKAEARIAGSGAPAKTLPPRGAANATGVADRNHGREMIAPPAGRPGTMAAPSEKVAPDDYALREPPKIYQQTVAPPPPATPKLAPMLSGRLGGYELRRKLGQGGMGTVYLARQLSLDRDVAVKVLSKDLSSDAQFVSRFVREAYAVAQLVHHNVVQIHDIGEEQQTHFYSMEYVKGQSLADLIRSEGAIAPDDAAGYVLQAARGLKVAHDQGMIHRDIKPENLLLSKDGIVKVADLGLVKRAGEKESRHEGNEGGPTRTAFGSTMGTPAYIAPEQAEDAANVDSRADIYSLGCTLFALLTGKPPFSGPTAQAVLASARTQEVPSPKIVNPHVPSELARITRMMTAQKREARYANIGMAIRELEQYLGTEVSGNFSPRQQHVEELEQCVKLFNESPAAAFRRLMIRSFIVIMATGSGLLIWRGHWASAIAALLVLLLTGVFYHAIAGLFGQSYLASRLRQMVFASRWRDWMRWAVIVVLACVAILAMDVLWPAMIVTFVSVSLALAFYVTVDRVVEHQRHHAMARTEDMLRNLRLKGLEEDALRKFVCEYSGKHWEEFFEAMFGYEAKADARKRWGRSARGYNRPKYATWRDPIIRWIDRRIEELRVEKERKHLLRVETKALQAQGVDEVAAAKQAKRAAQMMMAQAAEIRDRTLRKREEPGETLPPGEEKIQKPRDQFRFDSESEKVTLKTSSYIERRYGGPANWLLGTRTRFVVAAILLLGFFAWRYQNRDLIVTEFQQMRGQRIDPTMQDLSKAVDTRKIQEAVTHTANPLRIAAIPDFVCDTLGTWNAGIAGIVLLLGSFMRSLRVGAPLLVAAAILVFGEHLPIMSRLTDNPGTLAMLVGSGIALATFAFMKRGE